MKQDYVLPTGPRVYKVGLSDTTKKAFVSDPNSRFYSVKIETNQMRAREFNGLSFTPDEVVVYAKSEEEAAEKALKAKPGWLLHNDSIDESVSHFTVIF